MAVELPPCFLGGEQELEDHREPCRSRARSFRYTRAEPHRRERRLDRVGRAQVLPVLSGEVEVGEKAVLVLRETLGRLGVLRAKVADEDEEGSGREGRRLIRFSIHNS